MKKQNNPLSYYGYMENTSFSPKTAEISISQEDNIISVTDDGALLATVKLDVQGETLSLLGKDGKVFSSVSLPTAALIESAEFDNETQELIINVKLADGSMQETRVSFADMMREYAKQADVEKNTEAIENEAAERSEADAAFAEKDKEIDDALSALTEQDSIINESLANKADKAVVDKISEAMEDKVDWTNISTDGNPSRKAIVLGNHDTLLGTSTSGITYNLIMLSKWDTVDVGSSSVKLNMNVPKGERPTVQEAGQSGDEANKLAYVSDIPSGMYSDMVNGNALFALTTSATSEEIKSALTDVLGDKTPLTAEQLDDCLKYGYYIVDSTLRAPIFIGWDGQGYTFTSVGLSSPKGQVAVSTVTVVISDGVYSVKRSGESSVMLTAANVTANATIKQMSDTIAELQQRIEALEAKIQGNG